MIGPLLARILAWVRALRTVTRGTVRRSRGIELAVGRIRSTNAPIAPNLLRGNFALPFATSIAALTAPQLLCPSTSTTFTPSTATAYSVLPSVPVSTVFPAIRETNRLPRWMSNISVGEIRESAHVMIAANGFWLEATRSPTGE